MENRDRKLANRQICFFRDYYPKSTPCF